MSSVRKFLLVILVAGLFGSQQSKAQTAPTALPAEMASNSGFEAVWTPVPGVTGYQLEVSTDLSFSTDLTVAQTRLFNVNPNDIPSSEQYFGADNHPTQKNGAIWYVVPELLPSTKYYYRIRSTVGILASANSNVIDVTTLAHPPQVAPLSWLKTVTDGFAEVQSLIGDDDGNIYAAGRFTNTITVGSKVLASKGSDDIFIAKFASDKTVLWAISMGGPGNDGESSLAIDSSGLYVVAMFRGTIDVDPGPGTRLLTNTGIKDQDGFYAKFKPSDGGLIWAHSLVDALPWSPACIGLDKSGVYISGYFFGTSDLGTGSSQFISQGENDVFFGKYDLTDGKSIWVEAVGGPHFDGSRAIKVGTDGVYVVGFFNGDGDWNTGTVNGTVDFDPSTGSKDLSPGGGFLAKYSLDHGLLIFAQGFTGSSNIMCNPYTVDVNKSMVYVSGNFHGTVDFGAAPNFQRSADDIGGFIGCYNSLDGSAIWAKTLQTVHFIHPRKLIADNAGFYLSGAFGQSVNFDPDGASKGIRSGLFGYDNFMARYRPDGTFDWVKTLSVVSIAPAARTSDGYFLGGMFWNQVNFDPYQGNANVTAQGTNMFLAKYVSVSPPFSPKELSASHVDTTSFTASWRQMPGATGYALDVSSDNFKTLLWGYDGLPVQGASKTISGLARGASYSYRVRSENSYGLSDNSRVATVNTLCTEKPSIKLDESDSSKPTLVSSSTTGNQWYLNGAPIVTGTNQTLLVNAEGSYTVQVTKGSCKSELSDTKIVSVTGIKNPPNEQKIVVFPNPVDRTANITLFDLTANEPVTIEILDAMGRSVNIIQTPGGSSVMVDVSNHAKGIYLVRAFQSEKYYHTKFVKE